MSNYKINKLDNGLQLITQKISKYKTCSILALVNVGAKHETKQNNGLSHFLEHLNFKKTRDFSDSRYIAKTLDAIGCNFNAYTVKNITVYHFQHNPKYTDTVLHILSQMLFFCLHTEESINSERKVVIEEIRRNMENPDEYIDDHICNLLYPNTPLSLSTLGSLKNIQQMTRKDIVSHYKTYYVPNNMILSVFGNYPNNLMSVIKKYFLSVKPKPIPPFPKSFPYKASNKPTIKIIKKNSDHCYVNMVFHAFPITSKYRYASELLALHLGGNMSSLLYGALREIDGLVYEISSEMMLYQEFGYLSIYTSTDVKNIDKVIQIIIDQIKILICQKINETILNNLKVNVVHTHEIEWENSYNIAEYYAEQLANNSPNSVLSTSSFINKYQKVSVSDINEVIDIILQFNEMKLVVIGNVSKLNIKVD